MSQLIYRTIKKGNRLLHRVHSAYERSVQDAIGRWKLSKMPDFKNLLEKISSGAEISSVDVLPYINQESREKRLWNNLKLAEAFYGAGNSEQAKVFIQRAWEFSGFDEQYLQLFIDIHAACDDVDAIRKAYKSLGMKKADTNNIVQALKHFNDWQYAYAVHRKNDDYQYDFEILSRIVQLARPHAFPSRQPQSAKNRKIRLAYLMFGMTHSNSVIVKISLLFAKYHDPSRFEVTFYVPEQTSTILNYQEAVENIKAIREFGWHVVLAPDSASEEESLIGLSRSIYESDPDILVTNAALADFKHYFITSLRPAPLVIGLCQGPPPQYIAPDFDWSITWFRLLIIDCPVDCSFVSLRLDLPVRKLGREDSKSSFGIPEGNLVVMTSGRPAKLQDVGFLSALVDLVVSHQNICLVVVGLGELPPIIRERLTQDFSKRIKVLGWVEDFHNVLSMADIVVDTYPSGGGVVIKDAMALGAPVVSFRHDYMKTFSQTECSAAEEVIGLPELLIDRGDFGMLEKVLSRLITDHAYRESLSELCKVHINETSGNPGRMVKDCEQVYLEVERKSRI